MVAFFNRYGSLDCCTVLSGKFFPLQFLLLCYNRTDIFVITEFFLTTTNVMEVGFCLVFGFVILLIKLSERLTRIALFRPLFFIPRGRTCSTTWMCVPSPGC